MVYFYPLGVVLPSFVTLVFGLPNLKHLFTRLLCFFPVLCILLAIMPHQCTRKAWRAPCCQGLPLQRSLFWSQLMPFDNHASICYSCICLHIARNFSLSDSGHRNSEVTYCRTVVISHGWHPFSISRPSHHCHSQATYIYFLSYWFPLVTTLTITSHISLNLLYIDFHSY